MADKFLGSVTGASFRVVARGVYTGASGGTVTIPEVDMARTTVNILSQPYAISSYTGNDATSDLGGMSSGSVYAELTSSTGLTIHNAVDLIEIIFSGTPTTVINTVTVPVSYEVITYA